MTAQRFRKRPVEIEALLFTGVNVDEVDAFVGERVPRRDLALLGESPLYMLLTISGDAFAAPGDWIIRDANRALRAVAPDIFAATYDPA